MARRCFFSFHYERDIWRASQIRNSWVTHQDRQAAGFWDAASWEEVKKKGDDAIKRWIDKELQGTSVTVVLVGTETNTRKYVDYEIEQSRARGNGLLAIHIHKLRDRFGHTDTRGNNPLDFWWATINGQKKFFSELYPTYDWIDDHGYRNFSAWVEEAARGVGR